MIISKPPENGKIFFNEYICSHCSSLEYEHKIVYVPGPSTDSKSCWGAGIPTTYRQCNHCLYKDGPWVSSDIVGGGW